MAEASTQSSYYVTVSSATQSDHLSLDADSDWYLEFTSAGAYALDVQSAISSTFKDVYWDATNKTTISSTSGPQSCVVTGGLKYRMDVDTYNNPITMTASRVRRK